MVKQRFFTTVSMNIQLLWFFFNRQQSSVVHLSQFNPLDVSMTLAALSRQLWMSVTVADLQVYIRSSGKTVSTRCLYFTLCFNFISSINISKNVLKTIGHGIVEMNVVYGNKPEHQVGPFYWRLPNSDTPLKLSF